MIGQVVFIVGTALGYAFPPLILKSRFSLGFLVLSIAITMVFTGKIIWSIGI